MALATPEKIQQFNELGFVAFAEPLQVPGVEEPLVVADLLD